MVGVFWLWWSGVFAGVFAISVFQKMVFCGEVVVVCVVNVVSGMSVFEVRKVRQVLEFNT